MRFFSPRFFSLTILSAALAVNMSSGQAPPPMPGGTPTLVLTNPPPGPVPQRPAFSTNATTVELMTARIFEEPLIPIGEPSQAENNALAAALAAFANRTSSDDFSALTGFLNSSISQAWYPAISFCLGWEYYHTGYYSKAIDAWEDAWLWSQDETEPRAKAVADRAIGELARMYSRIGGFDQLQSIFEELGTRQLTGPATELISSAKQAHWLMENRPEISFRCGPLALGSVLDFVGGSNALKRFIYESTSTQKGFSLSQVSQLSQKLNLNTQIAFRQSGAQMITPSVVHWKVGHYAALLKKNGTKFVAVDPTFGKRSTLVSQSAIDAEASGYFIVPAGRLPNGWRSVPDSEAQTVWGKGVTGSSDPGSTTPYDLKDSPDCVTDSSGMPTYAFHLFLVSLNIEDTPLRCVPPRGPPIAFTVTYNQREANQPANFNYFNLGAKWTCNWLSYIKDSGALATNDVECYIAGGGTESFTYTNAGGYMPQWRNFSTLNRRGTNTYEMTLSDGSRRIFSQPDGTVGNSRKVFLTQIIDAWGYTNLINYSSDLRISTVTDPAANATNLTFFYNSSPLAGATNAIYQVVDRYGRSAFISYKNINGPISTIADSLSLTSQVFYAGNFINKLQTPYGTTTFAYGDDGAKRWLEATDPYLTWSGDRVVQEVVVTDVVANTGYYRWFYDWGFQDSRSSTNKFFVTRDHLGSIRETTVSNAFLARYSYDPFGNQTLVDSTSPGLETPIGFTGLYTKDSLNFALFRVYDADLGRWLSRDPIGEAGGLNLYSYAGNDPVNRTDLTGLCPQKGFAGAGGQFRDANTGLVRNGNGLLTIDQLNPFNSQNVSPGSPPRAGPRSGPGVHKNSLRYVGETHIYRIVAPDGTTYKIGESARGTRISDGLSIRAEEQVRRLVRESGPGFWSEIRQTFSTKAEARAYERQLIQRFRDMFGDDALPGNKSYH
jgi:RHS repeat-associated protein